MRSHTRQTELKSILMRSNGTKIKIERIKRHVNPVSKIEKNNIILIIKSSWRQIYSHVLCNLNCL